MAAVLAYLAAGIVFAWGVSHAIPTRQVIAGFGAIDPDNRQIIKMEWVAESLSFWFVSVLVFSTTRASVDTGATDLVYRISAGFLVSIGIWTSMTGARTAVVWFKLCPAVMGASATLLVLASVI